MAKSKKPSFKDCSRDWQDSLIKRMFEKLDLEDCAAAAIGFDMAAKEDNWGLCVLTVDIKYENGKLQLLLPHHATVERYPKQFPIKPTLAHLRDLLAGLRERKIWTVLAVDVPLGWPGSHGDFTNDWSAMNGATTELPTRDEFEYRLADLRLKERLGANLFAVGADKIASAAFQWANVRTGLGSLIDACDVGFGTNGDPLITLFETYPAAFVRLNCPNWVKYKSGEKKSKKCPDPQSSAKLRCQLVDQISQDYSLDSSRCQSQLDQACLASRSDAFDGFLSALSAWDYLRWRRDGTESHTTTTPEALFGNPPTDKMRKRIEAEGWILTRMSPLKQIKGANHSTSDATEESDSTPPATMQGTE